MNRARVLVIDDDESIRQIVAIVLGDEGFEVRSAANGQLALELLDDFDPDIILLDVRMPILDGFGFAEAYRARPGRHASIVAFVAALHAEHDHERIGASAVLEKPFDLEDLLRAVDDARLRTLPVEAQAKT
jgi:CheY-like chemotaxis protein